MPLEARKFIFTVSLCAMLAVNPVLATAPTNDEDLGTTHDVYVESTLNQATNGIAGVSYVNRMVNAAGNAAAAAEGHAAAAGAHALSAAQSADEAHKVLADKVNIDQGADKKNLAMVTDDAGSVYPGYIDTDMIEDNAITTKKIGNYAVTSANISSGAITAGHIAYGAVTSDNINRGAIGFKHIDSDNYLEFNTTGVLLGVSGVDEGLTWISPSTGYSSVLLANNGEIEWGKISAHMISGETGKGQALIIKDKEGTTVGWGKVIGMVPVGSADATTYGQFWIE